MSKVTLPSHPLFPSGGKVDVIKQQNGWVKMAVSLSGWPSRSTSWTAARMAAHIRGINLKREDNIWDRISDNIPYSGFVRSNMYGQYTFTIRPSQVQSAVIPVGISWDLTDYDVMDNDVIFAGDMAFTGWAQFDAYRLMLRTKCEPNCRVCEIEFYTERARIMTENAGLFPVNTPPSEWNIDRAQGTATPSDADEGILPNKPDCCCDSCKAKRGEAHKLKRSAVHIYSFKPTKGWQPKRGKNDVFPYCLGVELETQAPRRVDYRIGGNEIAADMRRPKNFWVAKRDGSVSGPEFASHPASLDFWHDHMESMAEMLRLLIHAGYRSHDGGTAGMHVNISREAFADWKHLARFMGVVHFSKEWSLLMSQRNAGQVDQWSRMPRYSGESAYISGNELSAEQAFTQWGFGHFQKYSAIHTPGRQPRIEFRLPRGTLRLDRFYKNLEWTNAMVEFSREASSVLASNPTDFMAYAKANEEVYPNLVEFINEKMALLAPAALVRSFM
jgi:hypothetical protein